jgi:hypothetical protein
MGPGFLRKAIAIADFVKIARFVKTGKKYFFSTQNSQS